VASHTDRFGSASAKYDIEEVLTDLSSVLGDSHPIVQSVLQRPQDVSIVLLDALMNSDSERPARDHAATLEAIQRLLDPAAIPGLSCLLARHAPSESWAHALVHALVRFGEDIVLPGLALAQQDRELRSIVVEIFALARVKNDRALELAFELLADEPEATAEFLAEWNDLRAIEPLRTVLARASRASDWDSMWALTDALARSHSTTRRRPPTSGDGAYVSSIRESSSRLQSSLSCRGG
jgi:hypothetical protein